MQEKQRKRGVGCLVVLLVVVVGGWLFARSLPDSGQRIQASDLGDAWPFVASVEHADVFCEPAGAAFVRIDGVQYALNGLAQSKYSFPYPSEAGLQRDGANASDLVLRVCETP